MTHESAQEEKTRQDAERAAAHAKRQVRIGSVPAPVVSVPKAETSAKSKAAPKTKAPTKPRAKPAPKK